MSPMGGSPKDKSKFTHDNSALDLNGMGADEDIEEFEEFEEDTYLGNK